MTTDQGLRTARSALLTYTTGNIGDDVQSLALAQRHLLGEPDLWMDRDRFGDYAEAGPVHLVANGFFLCPRRDGGGLDFPPPPNVRVTYVALCASNVPDTPAARAHFAVSGPIGCRDEHTLRWCQRHGYEPYFASCPSCLLERDFDAVGGDAPAYDPAGPIVLVDVDPRRLPPFGRSGRPFLCLTNRVRPGDYAGAAQRFAALRSRLRVLRGAALVITNRLHVAMPCLGLGVPVVMVETGELPFRLGALPPWMKVWREDELRRLDLDPASHRTAEWLERRAEWRAMVGERLRERVGR